MKVATKKFWRNFLHYPFNLGLIFTLPFFIEAIFYNYTKYISETIAVVYLALLLTDIFSIYFRGIKPVIIILDDGIVIKHNWTFNPNVKIPFSEINKVEIVPDLLIKKFGLFRVLVYIKKNDELKTSERTENFFSFFNNMSPGFGFGGNNGIFINKQFYKPLDGLYDVCYFTENETTNLKKGIEKNLIPPQSHN